MTCRSLLWNFLEGCGRHSARGMPRGHAEAFDFGLDRSNSTEQSVCFHTSRPCVPYIFRKVTLSGTTRMNTCATSTGTVCGRPSGRVVATNATCPSRCACVAAFDNSISDLPASRPILIPLPGDLNLTETRSTDRRITPIEVTVERDLPPDNERRFDPQNPAKVQRSTIP